LLCGSCSVKLTPDVWQCVRSIIDSGFFGSKCLRSSVAQSKRAARSLATSMKKFIPIEKKNDRRGAKSSIDKPRFRAARTYSRPSAIVNASSKSADAPASCMW
jgi:hypothetical protein